MRFEQLSMLLSPEKLPYPSGVERLSGRILHIAALTRMPDVAPKLFAQKSAQSVRPRGT